MNIFENYAKCPKVCRAFVTSRATSYPMLQGRSRRGTLFCNQDSTFSNDTKICNDTLEVITVLGESTISGPLPDTKIGITGWVFKYPEGDYG